MTILLIFFALPIATIIISIALQKILKCPILVSGVIFAIFLIVTFVIGDLIYLVATIVYAIIAFITAFLTKWITRLIAEYNIRNNQSCCNDENDSENSENNDNNENECNCNNGDNGITVRANVFPNVTNNGNTGNFTGCYRRR